MRIITVGDNNYSKIFSILKSQSEEISEDISTTVRAIIKDIKSHGDVALITYTNEFDRNELTVDQLRVTQQEIDEAYNSTPVELRDALQLAADRIQAYQERIKPADVNYTDEAGVELGARYVSLDSVGIYVPGGKANYPSSVLMNAIPAMVAGVSKIVMVCPSGPDGINPVVLAAAKISGIKEIYRIGGAQAVAALAYGTNTIPKVDKIVGPGNAYVAEAKRQVFGEVGIDMIAGPSEILVIADDSNNPEWLAADLLSQAEHDEIARSILITTSQNFAQKVNSAVYELMQGLERRKIAQASIENRGLVIVAQNMSEAVHISNTIAPEHLELAVENPEELLAAVTNAGAVFLGRYTPEAIGDYIAGPSHVLPTSSSARFSSGLSVVDFLKRQSVIKCSREAFNTLAKPTFTMAESEGLGAHALSVSLRQKK